MYNIPCMKNIEVEMRALINDASVNKIIEQNIISLGAKQLGVSSIHDIYFCEKVMKSLDEVEMNDVGSYSLRLRKKTKDGTIESSINTKIILSEGDHFGWEEHETEIQNFDEMRSILTAIGFKVFFELEKDRTVFEYHENIEINLENIKNFGTGIEIEIMCSNDEIQQSKENILKLFEKIGVKKEMLVEKSITNIIMKERAQF